MNPRLMAGPWITDLERKYVADALTEESWYDKRYYYVEKFEKEFALYHDRKHALMTPNCTQAIHLLLLSLGIKEGDEVIVPECTWTSSAAPVTYCKATPIFCDILRDSWCVNPEEVRNNITAKTKAIIAVDLYGNMANMEELEKISKEFNIPLIEDSAEALGSVYRGKRAGKFGVGSVFSFHSTKTITTGEGGMLLLDDEKLYKRAKFLRDLGRDEKRSYWILETGPKYMPDNLRASLGYAQFLRLKELVDKKRWIFEKFKEKLSEIKGLQFNVDNNDVYNSVWATSIVWDDSYGFDAEYVAKKLGEVNLPARHFFYPLSSMPGYSHYKTGSMEKNPVAYDISSRGLTLPCALVLKEEDIDEYANALIKIFKNE